MKRKAAAIVLGMVLWGTSLAASAAVTVPETVFKWVQSSSRINYYFNQQQICYGIEKDGSINKNILIVPVLKTYDDVQKQDVIAKRRWNMMSIDGFGDLVGDAEYLRINLEKQEVTIEQLDYVDSTWTTIVSEQPNKVVSLGNLAKKNKEGIFYQTIIDFAKEHEAELTKRTESKPAAKVKKDKADNVKEDK